MQKSKKILIIIIITVIILIILGGIIFAIYKINEKDKKTKDVVAQESAEELEATFLKYFSDIEYTESEQNIVNTVYEYTKSEENKYEVDVHFPKLDLTTCDEINNEIINVFGAKLLDVVKTSEKYTKYNVDYVSFVNDSVISLIIKCTLKEGDTPQRLMVKTYNYDLNEEKLITFEEMLARKNLDAKKIQEKIYTTIKANNFNTEALASQGYNIYVRDLTSNEYTIENINEYYLNENGDLYIIFAYGNNNFTGTMDIIKLSK